MLTITENAGSAKPFATRKMMAKRYEVCPRTITNWMALGLLVFFKIRNVVRFDVLASDALLKEHGLV